MALDGIVISNITAELNNTLKDGRIYKIAQPEKDELLLTFKCGGTQKRLFISADAGLPLIYFTESSKTSPLTAPNFCMLLRKHLQNGRILSVTQPGLERILVFEIQHLDDLGDLCTKKLIVELMGKHSNIIFCDEQDRIIDSIKHIPAHMSSVREVLPGRSYFIPQTQDKINPLASSKADFYAHVFAKPLPLLKAIFGSLTGISPTAAESICTLAGIDSSHPANALSENECLHLYSCFERMMDSVRAKAFAPCIIYQKEEPVEFFSLPLAQYAAFETVTYPSVSQVLETYYASRNKISRIRQKSADLRKVVNTALERNRKKYELQLKQFQDTEQREKYKVYGELITAYGYSVPEGSKSMEALNYYTDETVTIPLNPEIPPIDNAKRYFDKYGKLKRTYEALEKLLKETRDEISHLESVSTSLDIALLEEDLVEIKEELIENGYIRRKGGNKKQKVTSRPFHFISSDGYHIYVGKNNYQNEELTFKFASGNDWWFHAKGIPGSHVIVKSNGEELPDRVFEEAGRLAAHYSKGNGNEKIEIDYTEKKNVKKPSGGKPGFVIYYTNYSLVSNSDISGITQIS